MTQSENDKVEKFNVVLRDESQMIAFIMGYKGKSFLDTQSVIARMKAQRARGLPSFIRLKVTREPHESHPRRK